MASGESTQVEKQRLLTDAYSHANWKERIWHVTDEQTTKGPLYQGEASEPMVIRKRQVPVLVTAICGVCKEGELTVYVDGGTSYLHSCSHCNVTQWHDQRYPRLEYEDAE